MEDKEEDVSEQLQFMTEREKNNGLQDQERLRELIGKHKNAFRLKLGNSPPAKVKPMEFRLQPGASPIKAKARRYFPKQRNFINFYIDKSVELGMAEERTTASWKSAPLAILTTGSSNSFRISVNCAT